MQSHSSHFVQDEQRKREESDQVNMKDIPAKGFGDAGTKPKVGTYSLELTHLIARHICASISREF